MAMHLDILGSSVLIVARASQHIRRQLSYKLAACDSWGVSQSERSFSHKNGITLTLEFKMQVQRLSQVTIKCKLATVRNLPVSGDVYSTYTRSL